MLKTIGAAFCAITLILGPTQLVSANVLVNGDFSGGSVGFASGYVYSATDLVPETRYTVGTNPILFHPQGSSFGDHTTGGGNMFLANGATAAGVTAWQQSFAAAPNTLYKLTSWAAAWGNTNGTLHDPSPSTLQWIVNDGYLCNATSLPSSDGLWTSIGRPWYSGTGGTTALKLRDLNTTKVGNDFALDDLVMVPLPTGPNLIQNPTFGAGNTGFSTGYANAAVNSTEGQFTVGTDPKLFNSLARSFGDRTTGSGSMMLVNGAIQSNVPVWEQSLAVTPNTDHVFTCWLASWGDNGSGVDPSPANLSFLINGVTVAPSQLLPSADGQWIELCADWNSSSATSASLRLVDLNTAGFGNDFALDDMAFVAVAPEPSTGVALALASLLIRRRHGKRPEAE